MGQELLGVLDDVAGLIPDPNLDPLRVVLVDD